eukprot:506419-Pleurochrysis_carterae.AAC.2
MKSRKRAAGNVRARGRWRLHVHREDGLHAGEQRGSNKTLACVCTCQREHADARVCERACQLPRVHTLLSASTRASPRASALVRDSG